MKKITILFFLLLPTLLFADDTSTKFAKLKTLIQETESPDLNKILLENFEPSPQAENLLSDEANLFLKELIKSNDISFYVKKVSLQLLYGDESYIKHIYELSTKQQY